MKLLFVTKRRPQQRDLVTRPYGRFFHLPRLLAERRHDVHVLLVGHAGEKPCSFVRNGMTWHCVDFREQRFGIIGGISRISRGFDPDWVVGCSDAWVGVLASHIAVRCGARLAIDAYDNYESYMPWNFPLHAAWRKTVAGAEVVTAAGPQLAARLDSHRPQKQPTVVVPMAADPPFVPIGLEESRNALGLPGNADLVGYFGGWARNRGTDVLLHAFRKLRDRHAGARLVLTGRPPPRALAEPGVIPLGYIDDAQLPVAISAMSVACVITADSSFGRFSYPAKLCEAMACNVPVVATATQPVRWMLRNDQRFLVPVADADAIAGRIAALLEGPERVSYPDLPSWADCAKSLERALGGFGSTVSV